MSHPHRDSWICWRMRLSRKNSQGPKIDHVGPSQKAGVEDQEDPSRIIQKEELERQEENWQGMKYWKSEAFKIQGPG